MARLLFVVCITISISSLHAEEVDQAVINEIREIRESMTLGKAIEGEDEAFNKALITIVTDDTEEVSEPEPSTKAEVCPNGGSCCGNVAGKVIAKALAAQLTSPPITPPDVVNPGQPVPEVQNNWHPAPLTGAISAAQMPAAPRQPDWSTPDPRPWPTNNQNPNVGMNRLFPTNSYVPHPVLNGPHQDEKYGTIHTLRETAHELDRMAHRLEMANLCDAADEIRDAACELREEARELLEEDHDEDKDCDDECEDDHDD